MQQLFIKSILDGVKLCVALTASHLTMRRTQDGSGYAEYGLAAGALRQHSVLDLNLSLQNKALQFIRIYF